MAFRTKIGLIAFCVGLSALGWLAYSSWLNRIEARIAQRVTLDGLELDHPLQVSVNGRVVTVSGWVNSEAERARVLRHLHPHGPDITVADRMSVLAEARPYVTQIIRDAQGLRVSGYAPSQAALAAVAAQVGAGSADLQLASGISQARWREAMESAIKSLSHLQSARLRLEDSQLHLTATARWPDDAQAARAALPAGYDSQVEIEVLDDGQPFALSVQLSQGQLMAMGKFPTGVLPEIVLEDIGRPARALHVEQARIDDADGQFTQALWAALRAMAQVQSGQLEVSKERIEITGLVNRAGLLRAERALRKRPANTELVRRLEIYDDGQPFYLLAEFDGAEVQFRGKIPYEVKLSALTTRFEAQRSENLVQAEITDGARDWTGALVAGLAGLREMQHGRLMVAPGSLHLSGTVTTPEILAKIEANLAQKPVEFLLTRRFDLVDDGTPPDFTLAYDAQSGARLSGKLPKGLDAAQITQILQLPYIEDTAQVGLIGRADFTRQVLRVLADWLRHFEQFEFQYFAGQLALKGMAAPGVAAEDLAAALSSRFVIATEILEAGPSVDIGAERIHAGSGLLERRVPGAWVPVYSFEPTAARCSAATSTILEQERLKFGEGLARFDVSAAPALAHLAGLISHCLRNSALRVDAVDHSFSMQNEAENDQLSRARAAALVAALTALGLTKERIHPKGFGDRRPHDTQQLSFAQPADRIEFIWDEQP
ncbi:BON domain-containing protein [Planktomarina sp.]|nr:BON domain-containing protein [Planktomarina sp.]